MGYYKHGNGRIQKRAGNGQFRHATLAQDFDLGTRICPACRALNPYPLHVLVTQNGFTFARKAEPPTTCSQCNASLAES